MRQLCSVLWLLCLAGSLAMADDLKVAGRVTIAGSQDPLPGVTISVKGTTISAVTSEDGSYALTLAGMSNATLEFSFLGFKPVTQTVDASNSNLDIAMEEAPLELTEELVITGFATSVKRKNLANAVGSYSAEQIGKVKAQTVDGALSGLAPGVTVSANSGAPGGGMSVKMRGVSTINASSEPLYVVDGVIISNAQIQSGVNAITQAAGAGNSGNQDQPTNRVADLIPSDVESIEVLKGPSAAAIYGSKAANGVVVITTKRGAAGKTAYEFNQSFGTRSLIKKIGSRKFTRETATEVYGPTNVANFYTDQFIDYEELMYGNDGAIFETNFSARGGNEFTRYYFAGSYLSDEGIVDRTGYDKTGLRLNIDHNFTDRLSTSLNVGASHSKSARGLTGNDNTGATFGVSLAATPSFIDLRPVNGVYPDHPFNTSNPIHLRDVMRNDETVERTTVAWKVDYNIYESAQQALDFNMTTGVDYFSLENDAYFPNELQFERDSANPGSAIVGETESTLKNFYLNLTHTLYAGDNTFRTTSGLQYENRDLNSVNIYADKLIAGQSNVDNAAFITASQNRVVQKDQGFFLQEEATLGSAILVTLGVRGDRSSVNGDTDKIYTYPKASTSFRLSEYDFWSGAKDYFSEFKVRLAYGETGNLPTPVAKRRAFLNSVIEGDVGLLPGPLRGNPEIEPERSKEIEGGFDGTFWDGKGTVEFTVFKKTIDNLLLFRQLPASSGYSNESFNGGEMTVDGTELALKLNPIKGELDWVVGLNYYTYENKVTRLDIPAYNTGGFATSLGTYRIEEGWSPTSIVGSNRNPDGTHIKLGDETPDFQIGWSNDIRYKGWTLSWLFDWKEGGDIINLTKLLTDLNGTTADLDSDPGRVHAWQDLNDTRPWIEDGGYVKLRELKLMYSLGASALKSIAYGKLARVDLSLQGRNLKTWTDYTSYDPEVSNFGSVAIGRSVEVTPFPSSKAWYFNIAVGL